MTTEMSDYLKDKEDRIAELERQKEILGKSADERAIAIQELEAELQVSDILIADLKNKCIELRQQLADVQGELKDKIDFIGELKEQCNELRQAAKQALNPTQDGR